MDNKNFKPTRNEELHRAMMELRRSSAASAHDSRPKRERTRLDSKRAAVKDWD